MDPLSNYEYPYSNYEAGYMYNVKMEPLQQTVINHMPNQYAPLNNMYPVNYQPNENQITGAESQVTEPNINNESSECVQESNQKVEEEDSKEHLKYLTEPKRRQKKKGKTSNYWNKKIEDKNFPFYGCTICNVSFATIQDLDQHVTIHKGRITSYDIRVRNQIKRKQKIKEMKRLKKLGKKIKKEGLKMDAEIEIKPEDGYIGNEKAASYSDITNDQTVNNENTNVNTENVNQNVVNSKNSAQTTENSNDNEIKSKIKLKKGKLSAPEDPRLMKLFKCFACQKQFSLSYYLKLHVRSHTDEKPYTCAECGQSFITASKLGRHTKRIHLAIKFQCRICYRYFSRFDILTRHFDKAHKEEKLEGEPYDYNAILPYLKELEEQLREKTEQEKTGVDQNTSVDQKTLVDQKTVEDQKPKIEEPWFWSNEEKETDGIDVLDSKERVPAEIVYGDNPYVKEDQDSEVPIEGIIVEEVRVVPDNMPVKVEVDDGLPDPPDQDDSFSDEDYFPTNTWAATPKIEMPPPSPAPKKRHKPSEFPLKCEMCEKVIKTPSYYRVHLRTHSGEKPFKCYICDRGFITSSKMHRHVLTHEEHLKDGGENKVKLEDSVDVKEELSEEVTGTKKRKKKKSSKNILNKEPKKREYRARPHACAYCNKRFLHLDTLNVHKKCHIGEPLILKCTFCLQVQPDEPTLREHERTHSGPKPYLCTECGRTYMKREAMIYHRKSHGEDTKSEKNDFVCDICSKTFNAKCKLQRHIISHKVDKFILRYECPVCAHMFNTKYHIQMHLSTHMKEGLILEENRSAILAMVLQNARKIPKQSEATDNLTYLIPADERSRVCNICGEVFQHFYYLEEHLKSHGSKIAIEDDSKAEEKKHICPICNKGFKLHYYLKLHSFTHSKEKPYICQQCGKGFITKGKLKRHLETHSGLKKYQCHICYKFFTRPSYLRIHVRTIHGTQDYNFRLDKQFAMGQHSV